MDLGSEKSERADLPERDPLRQLQRKLVVTEPPGAIFFSDDA